MDVALYHPELGYYARAAQRSGRAGDFFTSVDVGPVFGELLEMQIAEMADVRSAGRPIATPDRQHRSGRSGRGERPPVRRHPPRRGAAAIPRLYGRTRLHLVEASAGRARRAARDAGRRRGSTVSSGAVLPASFEGVLIANELLDALPIHQVVMREDGLREVYVDRRRGRPVADDMRRPACRRRRSRGYLERLGVVLEPGWRAEINLRPSTGSATSAQPSAARICHPDRLRPRGTGALLGDPRRRDADDFHAAHDGRAESADSRRGCATRRAGHHGARRLHERARGGRGRGPYDARIPGSDVLPAWAHRSVKRFEPVNSSNALDHLTDERLALKTLLMPGGLGSTHKVLILGKGVGTPRSAAARTGCASHEPDGAGSDSP